MARVTLDVDLNRVEGDLEFQIDLEDGVVADARCIGTMYRGFEQILIGRAPRDPLVITPRICGICGTAHLYSAVLALEQLGNLTPPAHAVHIRNIALMAENLQSDLRQTFLFFTPDFCHTKYAAHPLADEMAESFRSFKGRIVLESLRISRKLPELIALFGGQWPHSTYMLPGGVTLPANPRRMLDAQDIVSSVRTWFEDVVLGDRLDAWLDINNAPSFMSWLNGNSLHAQGALGRFTRFSRSIGLHELGRGTSHMLSYGVNLAQDAAPVGMPAGFRNGDTGLVEPLDHMQITEHVGHSWFLGYPGGRHPWQGETIPDYQPSQERYSWAKAPRYRDKVVQTGPLAELSIAGDPLILDLLQTEGDNTWLRQFARLRRAAWTIRALSQELQALASVLQEPHYLDPGIDVWPDGESYGLVEAARGALGHWMRIKDGVIEKYQIVTPTAWNASPRDSDDQPGHWEQSIIGMHIDNPEDPVEIGHVVRSHDPCLVCTVHFIGHDKVLHYGV